MRLRTLVPLAVLIALAALMLAVRDPAEAPRAGGPAPAASGAADPSTPTAGFPREVTVGTERLRLEARPERILPCNASAVDYLVSLVEPSRVLGLPYTALAYATIDGPHEGWDTLPRLHDFSSEAILALAPDLILTHGWQEPAAMRTLENAGVPVLRLPDVRDYEGVRELLLALGSLLGEEDASRALVDGYDARVAALRADGSRAGWSALTYSNYGTGGWTAGAGTTADLVIGLAGLSNAAAEAGLEGHVGLEIERLLTIDPDVLVLGVAAADEGSNPTLDLLRGEPSLAGLSAVRKACFAVLPSHLALASSHRVVDAAEALATAVDGLRDRLDG